VRALTVDRTHADAADDYDEPSCLPSWAQQGLGRHEHDARPHLYSAVQMEEGRTHDLYWNAAQLEMVITGKMHNYLRMYWAKQVIQWTPDLATSYRWVLQVTPPRP
jgi:deoxyribodipyrimidine photo-lyase